MKDLTLQYFHCPICHGAMMLSQNGRSCLCGGARQHCFDFSKSGYLNLCASQGGEGDKKDAVRARRSFLGAGYYQPLADKLSVILDGLKVRSVLDAGCGEGYYTNQFANGERAVIGIDLSKDGIDLAARQAKAQGTKAAFAVSSIFSLPIKDHSIDAVVSLFAPCAEAEFSRVLSHGGYLLLVGAGERHLMGLKEILYESPYLNPGRADLPERMKLVSTERLSYRIDVEGQEQIEALFSMTPYYWRTSQTDRAKLNHLDRLSTEVDFDIFLFRKGDEQ